ncbi:helix-turn-helix domain-containing protein [Cellulosimicrobium sp. 22601]|uniref:helix-turn-helix domain-containing protein n=1 Tax=unclassified Cellulosimicrobium TaxID=2624466 RepID=UPI003F836A28
MSQRFAERVTDAVTVAIKERGLSQTTVAAHLGISQAAVNRRLRGQVSWRINELERLAVLLEVDESTLVGSGS